MQVSTTLSAISASTSALHYLLSSSLLSLRLLSTLCCVSSFFFSALSTICSIPSVVYLLSSLLPLQCLFSIPSILSITAFSLFPLFSLPIVLSFAAVLTSHTLLQEPIRIGDSRWLPHQPSCAACISQRKPSIPFSDAPAAADSHSSNHSPGVSVPSAGQ